MATKKKMLQAAAGNVGGAGLNVEDVFSTYLYTGNGGNKTITNGIDLDGEGGLVWIKSRDAASPHNLANTNSGAGKYMNTAATWAEVTNASGINAFNSDGFSTGNEGDVNRSSEDYSSWTFRKAPKFFDVVTYTGTGSAQNISHDLGSVPGVIIVKRTSGASTWPVWHRSIYALSTSGRLLLNETSAYGNSGATFNSTEPTDSVFTVGTSNDTNASGSTYVAYLFAHNDGDGEFGADGDADIIKCGSFTASGKTASVDLGFEPQWILTKCSSTANAEGWEIFDSMRGMPVNRSDNRLFANSTSAEETGENSINLRADGFDIEDNIVSGGTYIYIAIRRGTKVPESGTEVFAMDTGDGSSNPAYYSGFPVDFAYTKDKSNSANWLVGSRLTQGKLLSFNTTSAESANSVMAFDYSDRWYDLSRASNYYSGMWKRAPGFFDVVAYTGNGTAGRTVSHNLGVAPEMMWVKRRNAVDNWIVYHSGLNADGDGLPETDILVLDSTGAAQDGTYWNDTAPTATEFTVGFQGAVNDTFNNNYIAYLFASLPGISKLGSYTGNGSSQTIDCGFTSGARFVLIKATNITASWMLFDTTRGIVSGNDPALVLNSDGPEITSNDYIDPNSSGFEFNTSNALVNGNGNNYIFYAIA